MSRDSWWRALTEIGATHVLAMLLSRALTGFLQDSEVLRRGFVLGICADDRRARLGHLSGGNTGQFIAGMLTLSS